MTITLAPQIETRLRRKAARTGENADTLAEALLSDALADEASEEELRAEYRQLVALELTGELSEAQASRLGKVTEALDNFDARSPAAQAMSQRLDETGRKLDEMLAILQRLPLTEPKLTPKQQEALTLLDSWTVEKERMPSAELAANDAEFEEFQANINRWRIEEGRGSAFR